MDILESISSRRSIRQFKSSPVSDEAIGKCLEAARLAPSSTNCQPWKFLIVRSHEKRMELTRASYDQKAVSQAPVIVVLLGDTKAFRKRFRTGRELVEVGAIDLDTAAKAALAYKDSRDGENVTPIMLNCVIAGEHFILEATHQGLGSCWVMMMKRDEVAACLNLPSHLFPVALIPLGLADQSPPPRPRYALEEIAYDESADVPWKK